MSSTQVTSILDHPQFFQWGAISAATIAGLGLLIYDLKNKTVEVPENCNVKLKIEALYHYPVKGLRGCKLDTATIGPQGFEDDRTFMLQKIHRHPETKEIVFREIMYSGFHTGMILFQVKVDMGNDGSRYITVTRLGPENPRPEQLDYTNSEYQLRFPLRPDVNSLEKLHIDMNYSETKAYEMGEEANSYFSKFFGFETRLVYLGDGERVVLGSAAPSGSIALAKRSPNLAPIRKLLPAFLKPKVETITFHDFGQYLFVTKESNDEVSSRLEQGVEMDIQKFRPNIIVSGVDGPLTPYEEDYWAQVVFPGNIKMEFGGTCWRCQAITTDWNTGKKAEGDEGNVWKKLAKDRRVDKGWKYGPVFGKYSYASLKDCGRQIKAGDEIVLTKRNKTRPIFDWPLPKAAISAFDKEPY